MQALAFPCFPDTSHGFLAFYAYPFAALRLTRILQDEFLIVTDPKYNHSIPAVLREYETHGAVMVHWWVAGCACRLVGCLCWRLRAGWRALDTLAVILKVTQYRYSYWSCTVLGTNSVVLLSLPCPCRVRVGSGGLQERSSNQSLLDTFTKCILPPDEHVSNGLRAPFTPLSATGCFNRP